MVFKKLAMFIFKYVYNFLQYNKKNTIKNKYIYT